MDETTKQCVRETRVAQAAAPGRPARFDAEYGRNGVPHLLLHYAPLENWRRVDVREDHVATTWAEGVRWLLRRLELVFTPRHGSWLNMAECEFSALARQCLDRCLADIDTVKREVAAWTERRNAHGSPAKWQFTTEDARVKLHALYPSISD